MHHFHSSVHKTEPQTDMGRCQGHTASVGAIKWLGGKVIDRQSPPVMSLTGRWSLKEKAYMYADELRKNMFKFYSLKFSQERRKQAFFMHLSHFLDREVISSEWNTQETCEINHGVTLESNSEETLHVPPMSGWLPGYYAGFWGKQLQYSKQLVKHA